VTRLEAALGTRLLVRSTRKLRLSDSGEEVLASCRAMLESARAALDVGARHTQEVAGMVRMAVPKALGTQVIHPLMPPFLARYPKVDVQLLLSDRWVDPIEEAVDLVIRVETHPSPGLKGRRLMPIHHVLCASPGYLQQHGLPTDPQQLRHHNCMVLGQDLSDANWRFRKADKTVVVPVSGRYAANHTTVRLDAARQHLGIATLPAFTAHADLEAGHLIRVLPDWEFITAYSGDAWILYPATRHIPPKLRLFIDYLAEHLSQVPSSA
jgi:DNA-binding transcriptional LysR family regulator